MPDIRLDAATLKLIEASQDPNEIAELCKRGGLVSGSLATDGLGNVIVASDQPSIVSQKPRGIDMDDRTTTDGNNPDPKFLEFRK